MKIDVKGISVKN